MFFQFGFNFFFFFWLNQFGFILQFCFYWQQGQHDQLEKKGIEHTHIYTVEQICGTDAPFEVSTFEKSRKLYTMDVDHSKWFSYRKLFDGHLLSMGLSFTKISILMCPVVVKLVILCLPNDHQIRLFIYINRSVYN